MNTLEQIDADVVQSMRAKDELATLALRGIKTALNNASISKNREPLTDEEITKVLKTEVKRRRDAITLYQQGGRTELAEREGKEIGVISRYLPAEMAADEIRVIVQAAIIEQQAVGPAAMGIVMAAAMKKIGAGADGRLVSQIVKDALTPKA